MITMSLIEKEVSRLSNPWNRIISQVNVAGGDAAKLKEDVMIAGAMNGEFRIVHRLRFHQPMATELA